MGIPAVAVTKATFTQVQAPASSVGVLAIIACSSTGTINQPSGFARSDLAVTSYGYGPLTDYAAFDIATANQPVVLCRGTAGVAATMGSITVTRVNSSTCAITDNSSTPYDHYNVIVVILTGGITAATGITYKWSMDGGVTYNGTYSLGTSLTLTIPNTGVSFTLSSGATLTAGDQWQVYTERPRLGDTDVTASLAALALVRQPWEGVLIDCSATTSTVGLVDTKLTSMQASGLFKFAIINSRFKTEPAASGETEAAYATAVTATFTSQSSIGVCVGADGGRVPSQITGWSLKRPTSLFLAARAMSTGIGVDASYVALGPVSGVQISDVNGNPQDHDEDLYPNLDSQRLVTLRSFGVGGPQGVYITNPNVLQPSGGAFPYLQHVRIANRLCQIAWYVLTVNLSRGVRKNPGKDPVTGAVTIAEADAAQIESAVNDALYQPSKGQVSAYRFSISRTDDISQVPAIINATLSVVALAYVKGYQVTQQFDRVITTAL